MAIHLLLVSINRIHTMLAGSVEVVLNCLGAPKRVPLYRIPSRCKHLDILKNILINCRKLTFTMHYSHVKAYQDDNVAFNKLRRKSQLNCICNHLAKQRISDSALLQQGGNHLFCIEEIGAFIGSAKLSLDAGQQIRFHAHRQLARMLFLWKKILTGEDFDKVRWGHVHGALHSVLRLFQVWALKHVIGIAGTMNSSHTRTAANPGVPAALPARRRAATSRYVRTPGALQPSSNQYPPSPPGWQTIQHTRTLRQSSPPTPSAGDAPPALPAQLDTYPSSKSLPSHKTR
jgi:hypothetical protein